MGKIHLTEIVSESPEEEMHHKKPAGQRKRQKQNLQHYVVKKNEKSKHIHVMCAYLCTRVRACVRLCVRVRVCVHAHARVSVSVCACVKVLKLNERASEFGVCVCERVSVIYNKHIRDAFLTHSIADQCFGLFSSSGCFVFGMGKPI